MLSPKSTPPWQHDCSTVPRKDYNKFRGSYSENFTISAISCSTFPYHHIMVQLLQLPKSNFIISYFRKTNHLNFSDSLCGPPRTIQARIPAMYERGNQAAPVFLGGRERYTQASGTSHHSLTSPLSFSQLSKYVHILSDIFFVSEFISL